MDTEIRDTAAPSQIELMVEDDRIPASFCAPADASAGLVFIHGWNGCREQYAHCVREATGRGLASLAIDLRGHDATRDLHARVNRPDNLLDVLVACDWMAGRGLTRLGLVGASYGAYLAAIASSQRQICWLALRAPALYPAEEWRVPKKQLKQDMDLRRYRERVHDADRSRALSACAAFAGHALIVESGEDEQIPHAVVLSYGNAFDRAASMACEIMPGADHELSREADKVAFAHILGDWLGKVA